MFKSKTVFVVGAGASAELGMPTGAQLTSQIAQMLTLKREQFRSYFTNPNIYQAIGAAIAGSGQRLDQAYGQYVRAADEIARNMHLASSIDNFLRTHHEDPIKIFVGKLAIVNCILKAEAATKIHVKPGKGDFPNFAELSDAWMNRLAKLLFNDIVKRMLNQYSRIYLSSVSTMTAVSRHSWPMQWKVTSESRGETQRRLSAN